MNKKEFLEKLEKKLKVLSEEEKKDILNEYEDIIDEKIKHGKTEEEAIKEFGDINALAKEILKSYKINPEYQKNNSEFIDNAKDTFSKAFDQVKDGVDEIVDKANVNSDASNILKAIIWILICFVPICLIVNLSHHVIGAIAGIVWVCLLIAAIVVFAPKLTEQKQVSKTEDVKKSNTKTDSKKTTTKKVEEVKKQGATADEVLMTIVRIMVTVVVIIPIVAVCVAFCALMIASIYFITKGVEMYAVFFLMLSLFGLFTHLVRTISNALFTNKKIRLWPFLLWLVVCFISGIFTIDYIFSFTYLDDSEIFKDQNLQRETLTIENVLNTKYNELVVDNNLKDNEIIIETYYYDEIVDIKIDNYEANNQNYYYVSVINEFENHSVNDIINEVIIRNLKDKKVYDYSLITDCYVKIYTNQNTQAKIH